MKGLMLHAGASNVERQQLVTVRTPPPTQTWYPIPHHRLLEGVLETLEQNHMTVVSEAHGLTKDGNRYFGLLEVANGHNQDDFGLVIGLRNSHDKSFPAGLVLGANVFVCDNLSFSSEVRLARKHTLNVQRDLPQVIARGVGRLSDLRNTQERRFDTYKSTEFTDSQVHDLVIRAIDARVIVPTMIPGVLNEWRSPRHPEFANYGKTAWRFWNGITENLKGSLSMLPQRTQALHGLMDGACGLVLPRVIEHDLAV